MADVDLDRLAGAYAHRPPSAATIRRAERAGRRLARGSSILDVGGGPGNHSFVWRGQGHRPILLDPSAEMLSGASARGLTGVRGRAQAMPFRSESFDLVWFHLSIHYGDWREAIDEAFRVATATGRVEIWTLGPDHFVQSDLARWFPSIPVIDGERFPDPEGLVEYIGECFDSPSVTHPVEHVVTTAGAWLPAIEAGFVSTLQLVPSDERARGIDALRQRYPDPSEEIGYDLRFTRIVADVSRG
jgi:SAM-dependent methyltransferase